jgi:cell division protein ZapD
VLQDLEKQKLILLGLRDHPSVAQDALEAMLHEMEKISVALCGQGKTGNSLREHEWLVSLRGRLAVLGGATQVDMPSYRAWQHKSASARSADLRQWIAPLLPLYEGLSIVLRLLRESGRRSDRVAEQGAYQQMLGGKLFQLLCVWVDPEVGVFPEISANKHMINIRFSAQDGELKPQQVSHDVSFQMALCNA